MKLLAFSDVHLDASTAGVPRFSDGAAAMDVIVQRAISERCDMVAFLGDLTDPDSGPVVFRAVEHAVRTALRLANSDIRSMWLAGNHDVFEDGSGRTTLAPLVPLRESARVPVFVWEQPAFFTFADVNVVALPFTASSHPYDPAEHLRRCLSADRPNLVLSHLSVPGIIPGEETKEMPRGREVMLPLDALQGRNDVCVLQGHYHRRQTHVHGGVTVNVVGSPNRFTFGDEEHEPGFLIVEIG